MNEEEFEELLSCLGDMSDRQLDTLVSFATAEQTERDLADKEYREYMWQVGRDFDSAKRGDY